MRVVLHCLHSIFPIASVRNGGMGIPFFMISDSMKIMKKSKSLHATRPFLNGGFTRPPISLQVTVGDEPRVEK